MADFAKRPEITVSTMGKVNNPTGAGVAIKANTKVATTSTVSSTTNSTTEKDEQHETKVKEEGSCRRNITRKKTDDKTSGKYDSKHKKQGGSGKNKWNEVDDYNIDDEGVSDILDANDPLYDDSEKNGASYVLTSSITSTNGNGGGGGNGNGVINGNKNYFTEEDTNQIRPVYGPMLTLPEFKIQVTDSLREYFQSSDISEFLTSLQELKCAEYYFEIIKLSINLSCDAGPRERELISKLLVEVSSSSRHLLSEVDVRKGFEHLLEGMDEMCIDIPDAHALVGAFLARAVVDEVLPPAFLSHCDEFLTSSNNGMNAGSANAALDDADREQSTNAVESAIRLLSREHCTARLEKVWGPGDGRPVEELKSSMDQLLKEYLLSRELDEAARCVRELNTPHFHHELIKRGIIIAMEEDGANDTHEQCQEDASVDAMVALYLFLMDNSILSHFQLKKGVDKVKSILDDIKLDVPDAPMILKEFEDLLFRSDLK